MAENNGSNALFGCIGAIIAAALFFYVIDWGLLSGRITEYPLSCPSDYTEGNGCFTLSSTHYYPDKESQTVRMKTEYEIKTLTKCSVISRRNWECEFDDGSASFGFTDGKFHSVTLWSNLLTIEELWGSDLQYISRFMYLLEDWNIL